MKSNVFIVNKRILYGVLAASLTLSQVASLRLRAQEVTAAINGIVTDPSGGVVAGAKVTAKDMERGTTWPTTTNDAGFYIFPRLPIGRYEVRVENPGFQAAVRSDILLQLNQNARIDYTLTVGDVNQTVNVTEVAPALQTQSTQLGTVIDSRTNTQLPLASRNYIQLTLLAPGSVHPNPQGFTNGQTTGAGGARPYINGNREQANNFILDGLDNNQVSDNLVGYAPSPDAIQEFNLIEQNASAEFGNFMGGIVSTSIKSGSNTFHGNVFEFFRNDKLNANRWDYNFLGTPRPSLRWNQFGATLGGPILRDKLFFFVDYQGERFVTPASAGGFTVLTALERQGNFSELLSRGIQIKDPATGIPYPNNVIPASQLSSAATKIVSSQFYPAPLNGNLVNNQLNSQSTQTNVDQGDARVDWTISEKDRLFGRYSQSNQEIPTSNSYALAYNSFNNAPTHNGVLDWTRTISPSLVNDARVGVNYVRVNTGSSGNLPNLNATFGIPGVPSDILAGMAFTTNSFVTGPNNSTTAIGNSNVFQLFADTVIQYGDTVLFNKGSHTMHIGFQGFRQRVNTFYSGNNGLAGTFTYNGQYSGRAESDFMLGLSSFIGTGTNGGTWGQRANIFSAFFQDDWRVTTNFTVNLGLRYEIHTPWVEVKDRQTNFGLLSGAVEQPGQNGNPRALYNTYNGIGNWQPRIGLAWTPRGGKTVIRAAYTLSQYLEGTGTNLRLTINPPFSSEHSADYTNLSFPATTLDQGFTPITAASSCTQSGLLAASPACFKGVTLRVWDPNVRPAMSNQWNFTVQRQFGDSTTVQASYVGQRSTHLMVPMPYFQRQLLSDGTTILSPYLSGNPGIQNQIGQISGTASNGDQRYNALQIVVQKRFSRGLSFQGNYTWSKCLTDSIGYYGAGGQSAPASAYWQNLYDKAAQRGLCFFDVTNNFSGYVTYDLPFGRNRTFGKQWGRALDAIAGGWQVNALAGFHNGFPLTINAVDASGTRSRGPRANCIAPPVVFGTRNVPAALGGGYQWFSPASYAQPTSGFGNCGVGTVRGPGLNTVDMSITKLFNVTERQSLEVRGEFINVSNTPILNAPTRSIGSNLGVVNSSQGPRNIQLGVKFNF